MSHKKHTARSHNAIVSESDCRSRGHEFDPDPVRLHTFVENDHINIFSPSACFKVKTTFVCFDALLPLVNNFSVKMISCLPGLNQY